MVIVSPMAGDVENELSVRGEPDAVAAFVAAVKGVCEGVELPFSLQVIDPMPDEFETKPYSDSDEFRELMSQLAAFGEIEGEKHAERRAFLRANQGLYMELLATSGGRSPTTQPGWPSWRYQHWGPKRDIHHEQCDEIELRENGREAFYRFYSADGGIEPAVATLAKRYPELEFDLTTTYEFDEPVSSRWAEGVLQSD